MNGGCFDELDGVEEEPDLPPLEEPSQSSQWGQRADESSQWGQYSDGSSYSGRYDPTSDAGWIRYGRYAEPSDAGRRFFQHEEDNTKSGSGLPTLTILLNHGETVTPIP